MRALLPNERAGRASSILRLAERGRELAGDPVATPPGVVPMSIALVCRRLPGGETLGRALASHTCCGRSGKGTVGCARRFRFASFLSKAHRAGKAMLWVAAIIVVLATTFPWYAQYLPL